jgi:hypothetical protein
VRHRLVLLTAFLALNAAPAAASERQLLPSSGGELLAQGPFATWTVDQGKRRVLWHDGRTRPFPWNPRPAGLLKLGTDARRRPVAAYTVCLRGSGRGCVVRERPLSAAGPRTLYRQRKGETVPFGDVHRGTLAILAGSARGGHALYLRPRGSMRLRRLAKTAGGFAGSPELGSDHVAFVLHTGEYDELHVVDLDGARDRIFAINDTFDEDCRCSPSSRFRDVVIVGDHVYWLEITYPTHMSGDPAQANTRIGRAGLNTRWDPEVEYYEPETFATSFAMRGSRIVYASGPPGGPGVYEVKSPDWRPSGSVIPART